MIDFAQKVSTDRVTPATPTTPVTPVAPVTPATPEPYRWAKLERLGDEIAELAAHIDAATYRLLVLIREFDQREGWGVGFKTCAQWLSWRTGIAIGPAREKVRVARALEHLPLLSGMMQRAELSYSKARALTRVATPENEEELMDFARAGRASHVERLVRAWRRVDRLEEESLERERHKTRSLTLWPDEDGTYVLRGRLDPEVGALLMRALEAANDALYPGFGLCSPVVSPEDPELNREQMRADAIGLLAERALQSGLTEATNEEAGIGKAVNPEPATIGRADRFQVVVHVDAEALLELSEEGDSMLEGVRRVPAGTSRRIACDTSRLVMTHGPDGSVLDVGRRTRIVPPAIRRALDHRDGGCRFPGCGLRFCDAHHIKHWADGGETRLDNLVLLCRRHHRAVHEDGFSVEIVTDTEGKGGGSLRFCWPDGRPFPDVPPAQKLAADPVAALEAKHSQLGVHVGPETAIPLWNGDPFDVGYAIYTLRRP